jgi:hypothetical protein
VFTEIHFQAGNANPDSVAPGSFDAVIESDGSQWNEVTVHADVTGDIFILAHAVVEPLSNTEVTLSFVGTGSVDDVDVNEVARMTEEALGEEYTVTDVVVTALGADSARRLLAEQIQVDVYVECTSSEYAEVLMTDADTQDLVLSAMVESETITFEPTDLQAAQTEPTSFESQPTQEASTLDVESESFHVGLFIGVGASVMIGAGVAVFLYTFKKEQNIKNKIEDEYTTPV